MLKTLFGLLSVHGTWIADGALHISMLWPLIF